MARRYEIVPGQSIGPFRLGITREEIEALNIRPMTPFESGDGADFPDLGIWVRYDESGRCREVQARIFGSGTATFVLAGQVVNDMWANQVLALFGSISPNLKRGYGTLSLPAAGLSAVKWEASDEMMFAISVEPPVVD